MVQVGGGRDLAEKPLGPEGEDQRGADHLYRDFAFVLDVVREIDRGHPARAELAVDAVAVCQRALQSGLEVGQVARRTESTQTWSGGDLLASRAALSEGIPAHCGIGATRA